MLASAALASCWHRGFFVLPTVRKYSLAHFALDSPEQCCGVCLPTLAEEDSAPCTFASLPVVSSGAARRAAQSRDLLSTISCLLPSEGLSAPPRCARLRSRRPRKLANLRNLGPRKPRKPRKPPCSGREVGARDPEHLALALLGVEPQERQPWERRFERLAAAADLAEERTVLREMPRRLLQDAAHQVEPVVTRGQRQARLMTVLGWQARHAARI